MDAPDSPPSRLTRGRFATRRSDSASASTRLSSLVEKISSLFATAFDHTELLDTACTEINQILSVSDTDLRDQTARELAPLLSQRRGPMAERLLELLLDIAADSSAPWPQLDLLLGAADNQSMPRVLELLSQLAKSGTIQLNRKTLSTLADHLESRGLLDGETGCRGFVLEIVSHSSLESPLPRSQILCDLFLNGESASERALAAHLLDADGQPASEQISEMLFGATNARFLAPYLAYTRATHTDLLQLSLTPNLSEATLPSLRRARSVCGETLLREVIAELGWARVNLGLEVRRYLGCSVNGSLPFRLSPAQSALVGGCSGVEISSESFLFVAHGGQRNRPSRGDGQEDPVARFRACNLAHAQLLEVLLDLAPLTGEKVRDILSRLDRIVEDFTSLFEPYSAECRILPALYRDMKMRVLQELASESEKSQLSSELTRLVQMFENSRTLGEVRTLHGLKRYLHQRGLKLGFQLIGRSQSTNRTVDLIVASPRRILTAVRRIRYADFEEESGGAEAANQIPYSVKMCAEGFARQLFYGHDSYPQVDAYCYGNEVHYYLSYGSHPAFLRIDYSPPLSGGMIDLEYYGISKLELTGHPDTSLAAINSFFRRLEFDVQSDNTHLHVRYDKERALGLGDICNKAEAVFRLAPYMMDVDWIIGSLKLNAEARRAVTESWAESFALWGALPLHHLLTDDLTGTRTTQREAPFPHDESVCTRHLPYVSQDWLPRAKEFQAAIYCRLQELRLDVLVPPELIESQNLGQLNLERTLLDPIQAAVARGEISESAAGFSLRSARVFQREHEAERFVAILECPQSIDAASRMADLVRPLERSIRFSTTGRINGFEVQSGELPLRGGRISIYVLRDSLSVIRLALFATDGALYRKRRTTTEAWISNASSESARFAALLLQNNYLPVGTDVAGCSADARSDLAAEFRTMSPSWRRPARAGERILHGLPASPGRIVGRAILGTIGRGPADCDGAIVITPTVSPQDNSILSCCGAIASTGGGILSHVGLIAAQFHKPSLIIQGQWLEEGGSPIALSCRIVEHSEEMKSMSGYRVELYRNRRERELRIKDGDVVVVDADEGTLTILGHDRETLSLHDGIKRFGDAARLLQQAVDAREVLALRGRLLQARQLLERLLRGLHDRSLAHYALFELLLGSEFSECDDERPALLRQLMSNRLVGDAIRTDVIEIAENLCCQAVTASEKSLLAIPYAESLYEVLLRRLQALRLVRESANVSVCLARSGVSNVLPVGYDVSPIDSAARQRLIVLRAHLLKTTRDPATSEYGRRHRLKQLASLNEVLGSKEPISETSSGLSTEDIRHREELADRITVSGADGGFELSALVGWKAASLAEVERLRGRGLVPQWFAVSDHAFREMLSRPVDTLAVTLREAIEAILAMPATGDEQKSDRIRALWRNLQFPGPLQREILTAYDHLAPGDGLQESGEALPFVAIRSSTSEEDAEATARAGEFDTFLYIRGYEAVLEHIRLAWGGLWTTRAIQNRVFFATGPMETGGGIIVQRMIDSRVSGVLHTINMVTGEPNEIVINAGLGLGEGIVSGMVAADHIVVAKRGIREGQPPRFSYTMADKREQVVFDASSGLGTRRVETLYHQRFRAAMEYVELCELVRTAVELEDAYGYPLDIEFGFEGTRLWILQARPVPTYRSILQETVDHWPLGLPTAAHLIGRAAEVTG